MNGRLLTVASMNAVNEDDLSAFDDACARSDEDALARVGERVRARDAADSDTYADMTSR